MILNDLEWRLRAWTPIGGGPRVLHRDTTTIRGAGLRLQVTPEGDGREASFTARGKGGVDRPLWGLPPLTAVQFQLWDPAGLDWVSLSYGQVRVGGNLYDENGEGYVLRSLIHRLGEVTLSPGFSTPKQPAHLTIRALIQDVLNSTQVGSPPLIEYAEALCPDLGFDANPILNGHQQTPLAFLERIQQDALGLINPVTMRFGVNADRQFYALPARTSLLTLTDAMLSGDVKRQAPVAEKPCTRVLWFVKRKADGNWLTHTSTSPDAATLGIYTVRMEVPPDFRTATTPAETPAEPPPAALAGGVITRRSSKTDYVYDNGNVFEDQWRSRVQSGPTLTYPNSPVYSQWLDVSTSTGADLAVWPQASREAWVIEYDPPPTGVTWGVQPFSTVGEAKLFVVPAGSPLPANTPVENLAGWNALAAVDLLAGTTGTAAATGGVRALCIYLAGANSLEDGATQDVLTVHTLRPQEAAPLPEEPPAPEVVTDEQKALLDLMARRHYKLPAQDPSDLVIRGALTPDSLPGRVKHGAYERAIEAVEYRLSSARGIETAFLTGQADDPIRLAQADLIKARDQNAKIDALIAPQ